MESKKKRDVTLLACVLAYNIANISKQNES